MQTLEIIADRRSIRKFKNQAVPAGLIDKILLAATQAPSGKNNQPWRFIVVTETHRAEMVRIMRSGIKKLKGYGVNIGSSEYTAKIMAQAPVTIFVFNDHETNDERERTLNEKIMNIVDVQSIGAAIQNMLLAAQDLGLGTLWICDVFFACQELCEWLGETHQMIAAVSIGYPAEHPSARPRFPVKEVTRWLE